MDVSPKRRFTRKTNELQNQLFIVDKEGDRNLIFDDDYKLQTSETNQKSSNLYELSDDDEFFSSKKIKSDQTNEEATEKKPAWEDDDDEIKAEEMFDKTKYPKRVKSDDHYKEYLESKFTAVFEPPSWAHKALEKKDKRKKRLHGSVSESDESDDSDDDDQLNRMERTARDYQQKRVGQELDPDFLRLKRCTHLNHSSRVKTALNCLNFHPNSTVALVGSRVGLVRVFQVDGEENAILQSIHFKGYRLCDAKFISSNGREEFIVGSDGSSPQSIGFCYYYDMIAGKIVRIKLEKGGHQRYSLRGFQLSPDSQYLAACDNNGQINILSASSKEHIAELKMNGDVDCLAFSPDSQYLVSHGKGNGCQAYVWDIRNIRSGGDGCVNRFTDLGTVEATSLAVSSSLCAIGSNMGYVNLYKLEDIVKKAEPQPIKSVSNLTTAVTSLRFNHDGQLLMMASGDKDDAIRFVNTCVGRVYKNFPAYVGGHSGKTYGRIYDIDISPNSGFAAWATGKGTAHLFRINDYFNY